jgi:GT2 family glycosyltransferase
MPSKLWISKIQIKKLLQVIQSHGWFATSLLVSRRIKQKLINKRNNHRARYQPAIVNLETAVKEIETWSKRPLISVILLTTKSTNQAEVSSSTTSLADQVYSDWELFIVSDQTSDPDTLIKALTQGKPDLTDRVKSYVTSLDDRYDFDINSVLEQINGDYFCLINSGDTLSKEALYQIAHHIHTHPESDVIYSDEDYLELGSARVHPSAVTLTLNPFTKGRETLRADSPSPLERMGWGMRAQLRKSGMHSSDRIQPILKPDWSPDYFYSYPYLGNLSVFRTTLVRDIGGFHREYGRAQVYDLVLRLIEHTTKIHHIPHCLYRRAQSPAIIDSMSSQTTVLSQQQQALAAMLTRSGYPGVVETAETPGVWRVRRHLLTHPLVSIVIPSAGKMVETDEGLNCLLETCIDSVQQKSHYRHFEIVVVDGYDIPEAVLSRLKPKIQLVRDNHPFNYSRRINLGVAKAQGDVIILLNDDTAVLSPDWIESMLELAQQEEIGAVGARLLFPDGKIQHTGVVILQDPLRYLSPTHVFYGYDDNHPGYGFSNVANYNYLAVTGACLMMRKQVFEALGGLPEDFPLNYNDVDLCLKAHQAGYRNVVTPYARLSHYGSASRPNRKVALGEKQHFSQIWGAYWAKLGHDPYYNPNFGSGSANFGVKDRQS